ncbi:MAG TPA: hypothetical protein VKQ70_10400 [Caulobacteraceae bacterium]|jgi:hypothetical protein|nr:hypothetical protein [Caulobacteraceae bacterium]
MKYLFTFVVVWALAALFLGPIIGGAAGAGFLALCIAAGHVDEDEKAAKKQQEERLARLEQQLNDPR